MKYRIKTITRILPADLQTPVGIYLKVRDLFPQSALLESSDYHTTQNSFSFIGVEPMADFSVTKEQIVRRFPDGRQLTDALTEGVDVIEILKDYIASFETETNLTGINGFFGYTAYDAVRYFEAVRIRKKEEKFAEIPDMMYILYRYIIVVDHLKIR